MKTSANEMIEKMTMKQRRIVFGDGAFSRDSQSMWSRDGGRRACACENHGVKFGVPVRKKLKFVV